MGRGGGWGALGGGWGVVREPGQWWAAGVDLSACHRRRQWMCQCPLTHPHYMSPFVVRPLHMGTDPPHSSTLCCDPCAGAPPPHTLIHLMLRPCADLRQVPHHPQGHLRVV